MLISYEGEQFTGPQQIFPNDNPSMMDYIGSISSIIVLGGDSWTLYRYINELYLSMIKQNCFKIVVWYRNCNLAK